MPTVFDNPSLLGSVRVLQMPMFKRAYKKLHRNQKAAVDKAVAAVIANPSLTYFLNAFRTILPTVVKCKS